MDGKAFRKLLEGIGSLTGGQIRALGVALRSLDSRMQAQAAIEERRSEVASCPHCEGGDLVPWGRTRTGLQRTRCRSCRRTSSSATGTAVAGIHEPGKLQRVLVDMLGGQPGSCRRLGAKLGLDKMTVWRWRQKLIQALEGIGETGFRGIVEADEKFFRESRKGSREWVNHRKDPVNFPKPDRPRWADFRRLRMKLPAGISKYQIGVLTVTDRAGSRRADVLPDRPATSLTSRLARHVGPDAVLCSDGDTAYALFASEHAIPHYRLDTKNGPRVIDRAFHIQTINSLHDRFERFMQPFRGPATKNLQGYAAWFIAGLAGTPQSRIEQAWDRLLD